jgi:glutamate synthase domain-containing protein 2
VFGFGTDDEMEAVESLLIIKHSPFPAPDPPAGALGAAPDYSVPAAKVLGGAHKRRNAFRPASLVNLSGMSYGSLSPVAIEALNRGAAIAGCLQNTGEGGIAAAHRHGGELVFQIGTGYFGCRDADGRFSLERLRERIEEAPVRAIEIKLSQGAKPGLGGLLPAVKVTPEIAECRGVPVGVDCVSPPAHSAFSDVDGMIEFVEAIAAETGLPVGIKSAVGEDGFWQVLAERMASSGGGPDFVTVDGGEGGTGAAPLSFSDHVALPFKLGFSRVYGTFAREGLAEDVVFVGSGRLGFPDSALFAFALGCDMINVGREAMMAIGCIQAQRCHTGRCPTGVATQSRWLMHGLDPELKSSRAANYLVGFRAELLALVRSCGVAHPALVTPEHIEIVSERYGSAELAEVFGYAPDWPLLSAARRRQIEAVLAPAVAEGPA